MAPTPALDLVLRSQSLTRDSGGRNGWQVVERE